ncbi:uncharacterized protein [Eurosta solidaginis]|uniref:uncharacterized protein isoform X2 n=1 Tax=Eurosta solidaginis TaxID=178769 RepID=UPI00353103FD
MLSKTKHWSSSNSWALLSLNSQLPLLVHLRSLNKEVLLSTLQYYIETVVCGAATGWTIAVMICVLRNLFGKFGYYTFLFWPTVIGSYSLWAIPSPRAHRLFNTSVFQCTIESFIMKQKNFLTKSIARSNLLRTFIFMGCSGLIMNAKRERTFKGFWFLEPTPCAARELSQVDKSPTETEISIEHANSNSCSHTNKSCTRYAMEGVRNYMIIGVTLDIIKMLVAQTTTDRNDFIAKLIAKLKMFRIRSCALLTAYVALYRLLHCYLNRNKGGDSTQNHTVAAILSGSCFIFYPKLTVLCYALVMGIQISWQHFKSHVTSERYKDNFLWINQLPCARVIYPVALGYLVNTYCTRPHYISPLGATIINGLTNNYAKTINGRIVLLEKQLESSLPNTNV